jgi:hypothetical protein
MQPVLGVHPSQSVQKREGGGFNLTAAERGVKDMAVGCCA